MTHLVLSFYPCVFTVEILLPWLRFCQRELFFYRRFDCIDLSIKVDLWAENLEVIQNHVDLVQAWVTWGTYHKSEALAGQNDNLKWNISLVLVA